MERGNAAPTTAQLMLRVCPTYVPALTESTQVLAVLFADDSQVFNALLRAFAVRHDSSSAKFGW